MSARGRDGGGEVPEPMAGEDLVSLLYGELEPDEAARASAQVAGDPTASARLGEMRRVRDLFAAMEDEEPPSRLTAQLMAEAARSAPQTRRAAAPQPEAGLWARFVSWLQPLVQRPALAAAASLVLVAGVAGVLYMKKGEELTSTGPTAERAEPPATGSPAPATPQAEPPVAPPVTAANQAAAEDTTGLADGDQAAAPAEEADLESAPARASKPMAKRSKKAASAPAGKVYDNAPAKSSVKSGTVYGLSEQEMVPRDEGRAGGEGGGGPGGGAQNKSEAPAPQAPPEPTPSMPTTDSKAPPRPSAQELHKRAIDAALDKRCAEVKMLAGQVRATDATYYARSFAGDKRLQGCMASPSRSPAKK